MVERRQRRAFAAGGDIGAAEIADDIAADEPRQQRAVADLPGAALPRAMQDRVAVKPDEIDRDLGMPAAKFGDRRGVQPGQLDFDRGDVGARDRRAQYAAQPLAEFARIRHRQRRSGGNLPLAVGRQSGDIDAVE